jgi:hypothetical protein
MKAGYLSVTAIYRFLGRPMRSCPAVLNVSCAARVKKRVRYARRKKPNRLMGGRILQSGAHRKIYNQNADM